MVAPHKLPLKSYHMAKRCRHPKEKQLVFHISDYDKIEEAIWGTESTRNAMRRAVVATCRSRYEMTFEHASTYERLLQEHGVLHAGISHIHVWTNDHYILGMEVFYVSKFKNGKEKTSFAGGWKANAGAHLHPIQGKHKRQTVIFHEHEYLVDIVTREGKALQGISFYKNTGEIVSMGSAKGKKIHRSAPFRKQRIVALFSTHQYSGSIYRLGFVATLSSNYSYVRHWLEVKALSEGGRATLRNDGGTNSTIRFLMTVNVDVLRYCLTFLMPAYNWSPKYREEIRSSRYECWESTKRRRMTEERD